MKKDFLNKKIALIFLIFIMVLIAIVFSVFLIKKMIINKQSTKEVSSIAKEVFEEDNIQIEEMDDNVLQEEEINGEEVENEILEEKEEQIAENSNNENNNNKKDNNNKSEKKDNELSNNIKHYIKVNRSANVATVYRNDNGNLTPIKAFVCSTGSYTPPCTKYPRTQYKLTGNKWQWKKMQGGVWAQYATQVVGNILMHSVPYFKKDPSTLEYLEYDKLGTSASAGCIRLTVRDAKWIYDNISSNTIVEFYSSSNPGPLGKPTAQKISSNTECRGWDPTDLNPNNPWHSYIQETTPEEKKNESQNVMDKDKNEATNNIINITNDNNNVNTSNNSKVNTNIVNESDNANTNTSNNGKVNTINENNNTNINTNTTNKNDNTNVNTNTNANANNTGDVQKDNVINNSNNTTNLKNETSENVTKNQVITDSVSTKSNSSEAENKISENVNKYKEIINGNESKVTITNSNNTI